MASAPSLDINFPGNLAQVEDLPSLRAVPSYSLHAKAAMLVLGGDEFGNGSGGIYTWDPGSIADDDDSLVIRPIDRTPLQNGRWIAIQTGARVVDSIGNSPGQASSQAAYAGADGATGIGIGADGLNGVRTADFYFKQRGVLLSADTGVTADGVTDSFAGAQRAITAAAGDVLYVPKGDFLINGTLSIPPQGLTIEGMGYDSNLILGGDYAALMTAVAVGHLRLYNLRMTGAGVVATANNGLGVQITGGHDIDMDMLWFDNFGNPSIQFAQSSLTTNTKNRLRNINVTGSLQKTAASEAGAIALYGSFTRLLVENVDIQAGTGDGSTSFAIGNGLVMSGLVSGLWWQEATLRTIRVRAVSKRGIAISNEDPAPDFRCGILTLDDIMGRKCAWQGIKIKNVDVIRATNLYADGCEATSVEVAGNLQGSIYINGVEDGEFTNLQVRDAGTDGVRINGRPVSGGQGNGDGRGQARVVLNGVCVRGTGVNPAAVTSAGINIAHSTQALDVNSAKLYDCKQGISIAQAASQLPPTHITLNSPTVRRTTSQGISISGASGNTIGPVFINSPDIQECGGSGIVANYADLVKIRGGNVSDSGTGGSSTYGIYAANCAEFWCTEVSSKNRVGTTQTHGIVLAGGNGIVEVHDNDLAGNATAPVLYSAAPTKIRARNNSPWLENTSASYTPPSLASGASTPLQSISVPGAEIGDAVDVTWSADLSGASIQATVASTNAIRWWIENSAGANPLALAAGAAKFAVIKQQG